MKKISVLIATLLLFPFAAMATPVVMDFEGVAEDDGFVIPATPYAEDGFLLSSSRTPEEIEGIFGANYFDANTNGSAIFGWCTECGGEQIISLARDDGSVFNFLSFDAAVLFSGDQGTVGALEIIGHLANGDVIGAIVDISLDWGTFELGWTGLTQVDFVSVFDAAEQAYFDPAIDNLVMNVPEPGTLALLGLGLIGLAARRRRQA